MNWLQKKLTAWLGIDTLAEELREDNKELEKRIQSYKRSNEHYRRRLDNVEGYVRECTQVNADISLHPSSPSTLIFVAGRFRGTDYVRLHTIPNEGATRVIEEIRDMERYNSRGYYDTPMNFDIKCFIDREGF